MRHGVYWIAFMKMICQYNITTIIITCLSCAMDKAAVQEEPPALIVLQPKVFTEMSMFNKR